MASRKRQLALEVRGGDDEEPPQPKARGGSWEEPPTPEARASGQEEQPKEQAQEGLEELYTAEGQEQWQ